MEGCLDGAIRSAAVCSRSTTADTAAKRRPVMHDLLGSGFLAATIHWGGWKFTGDFTLIDLIAASTNALNGALLARRPDHYRNFTIVGVLLMALLGGLGGGITRDVLLGDVPSAFLNPAYITLCLASGVVGYVVAYD